MSENRNLERVAGPVLIVSAIASIAALALDPSATASDTRTLLQQLATTGPAHQLAHAVQMTCVTGYAFGFSVLASRLGLKRAPVLAGLVAYGLGVAMMLIATVNDGFLTPAIAQRFVQAPAEDLEIARDLIRYAGMSITYFGDLAFVLMGVGVALWASVLAQRGRFAATTAAVGLVIGLGTVGAIAWRPALDMGVLMGVVLGQLVLNVLVGALLLRGLGETGASPAQFGAIKAAA